jgi:predicted double-glycine peptidase
MKDGETMKKINYIKQPTDYLCGQACVAMLADVTVIQSYLEIYIDEE